MRQWVRIVIFTLCFLLVLVILGLYQFGGLKEYMEVILAVNRLTAEEKVKAKQELFVDDWQFSSGILAGVTKVGKPAVWVWGKRGLRKFLVDEYSVYSFFNICNEKVLLQIEKGEGKFSVERSVDFELDTWRQKVKKGDFVAIGTAQEENGGNLGYLREAKGYDWWVFMPTDIRKQCAK